MPAKDSNIFSEIYKTIRAFDDLSLLDEADTLTGKFKIKRKTNRQGISNIKATVFFKDDIVSDLDFKKVKFKDKVANSLFGDAQNPRKDRSGDTKLDYFDGSKKLVELSVEDEFLNEFEQGKIIKGFFRASLDDNFIAMSLDDNFIAMSHGQSDKFLDRKILTAEFEIPFLQTSVI